MYDVIIVGARVAGAPTAMLLARRGLKVLVLDRATFPSDTLSTHQVQLPGVARLARWGLLNAVLEAGTPVTRDVRFDQGDFTARLAAISPPTPAEMALFRALARRQEDADMFVGALAGSVPLRQFMSPRTMMRLVGVRGFARLALGQARPRHAGPAPDGQVTEGSSARSADNASVT